jgi:Flp pilus assembly protein TadD
LLNPIRHWIDAAWPAALLLLFLGTFRSARNDAVPAAGTSTCDSPAALDAAALEQCLISDPENAGLIAALGDAYAHRGDDARAEELYRHVLRLDARDGDVHLRLGELLLARGDADSARLEGSAALAVQPGSLAAAGLIERASTIGGGR